MHALTTFHAARSAPVGRDPSQPFEQAIALQFPTLRVSHVLPIAQYQLVSMYAGITVGEIPEYVSVTPHWHDVSFIVRGDTRINWRWGRREIRRVCGPGAVTIAVAGEEYQIRSAGQVEILNWGIAPAFLDSVAEREFGRPCGAVEIHSLQGATDDRLWELGRRLTAEVHSPRYASQLYFDTLATQLAICLLRDHSSLADGKRQALSRVDDDRIRKAIDYIHSNLSYNISLEDLAIETGLSSGYLVTAFKQATGLPPHRYQLEKRIERAKVLLANPHRTITQVALDVGFSSQSHLTSVFKRLAAMTPKAYRSQIHRLD
jgi:AraC family transcriptional regulator